MPKKYTTIDGVATLVHYRGVTTLPEAPPDVRGGPCVICLHDAGNSGGRFDALLDALAPTASPLAYDQPGHGRSGGLDSLGSIEAMAHHLHHLTERWQLPPAVLVGEGMGAAVALTYAAAHGEKVSGMALIGQLPAPPDLDDQIDQLSRVTAGKARREFDRSGYGPDTGRPVYQAAFADWVTTDPRATLGDRRAQAAWLAASNPAAPGSTAGSPMTEDGGSPAEAGKAIRVLIGQHQPEGERNQAEAMAQRLGARTATVSGAGRNGVIEAPETVAAIVVELAKHEKDQR